MNLSPAFHELRSAYQAEMDDLSFDSEGRDVLRQRLKEKREELGFMLQMTEISPEMVAVVFHQGFRFTKPGVMDRVVSEEIDDVPDWDEIREAVVLTPWAQELADIFLMQADGQRFMTIAAALAYLYAKPQGGKARASDDDEDGDGQEGGRDEGDDDELEPAERDSDEDEDRAREEAGADWMVEQGFDRKD
jgi:hypothetical protein